MTLIPSCNLMPSLGSFPRLHAAQEGEVRTVKPVTRRTAPCVMKCSWALPRARWRSERLPSVTQHPRGGSEHPCLCSPGLWHADVSPEDGISGRHQLRGQPRGPSSPSTLSLSLSLAFLPEFVTGCLVARCRVESLSPPPPRPPASRVSCAPCYSMQQNRTSPGARPRAWTTGGAPEIPTEQNSIDQIPILKDSELW